MSIDVMAFGNIEPFMIDLWLVDCTIPKLRRQYWFQAETVHLARCSVCEIICRLPSRFCITS